MKVCLSILIVNWNTRDLVVSCLKSIFEHPPSDPFEVIVVDNASSDKSADAISKLDFPIKLIESPINTGYAQGNNLAFEASQGEFLLTLNPDTEFNDSSLQTAIHFMNSNPKVGSMGAKQIGIDGKIQSSIRGFPTIFGVLGDALKFGRFFPKSKFDSYRLTNFDYTLTQSAPQPMGTFILFRRSALESVGNPRAPFDLQFPIFFNEVDLLYRLDKMGWGCYYNASVSILHYGGASTKQVRKKAIWESHKSLIRFWRKHTKSKVEKCELFMITPIISLSAFVRAKGYSPGFYSPNPKNDDSSPTDQNPIGKGVLPH